jgi:hypothetical protein
MKQIQESIISFAIIAGVLLTAPATYAVVNVLTRPDIITVAVSLPQRKGIVTMWDPIDNEVGLGDSPDWYTDYEANIVYDNRHLKTEFIFANERGYSIAEHVCLAKNIYFEARNESLKGQLAIALVTLNRLQEARWSEEVCGVVYANKQFSWFSDGLSDRPRNYASYDSIALVASHMLDADMSMHDFTYGSTHYHANYVKPYWSDYMILKASIDTHLFYFEPVVYTTASL